MPKPMSYQEVKKAADQHWNHCRTGKTAVSVQVGHCSTSVWAESAANFLTNAAFDPNEKISMYRVCAIRVEKIEDDATTSAPSLLRKDKGLVV